MGLKNASMYRIATSVALALSFIVSSAAQAQGSAKASAGGPPKQGADGKVDISDLENKYWAPKDTDFSVVQNRTFSKDNKILIAPQWGRLINDPYSEGNLFGLTANYFWSERMGVQLSYMKANLENNQAVKDLATLATTTGARPDHGKISSYYGVGYNLVPFYAKMSFWGKRIIYFDMAFTPHIGMTIYDQQIESGNKSKSALTYGIDISQLFFFNKYFAIRADLRNQWRSEEIVKYRGTTMGQVVTSSKSQQDTLFLIGATFYFGNGR